MLEFRLLGPLEVTDGERPVTLPGRKARAVLAALLLRAGEEVSGDRLIEDVWGEEPPSTAKNSLHNHVSALRKLLGAELVVTGPAGYVLRVDGEQIDLTRFRRLIERADRADEVESRATTLREALALWRGPALADLAYEPLGLLEAPRLEELRLAAQADLIEAELALGRDADLLPELEALVEAHPYDERLRGLLMLALYRAGRQADALDAYASTRNVLVEELGIDPSQPLRELHQAILRQDESLLPVPQPALRAPALPTRKTVTVLWADLVDATVGPEQLDPEAHRHLLERNFTVARDVVERHGGTLGLAGDAVQAVFGVPAAHEDDALRALRSAYDLHEALATAEGQRVRIGVNTGEVFAGGSGAAGGAVTGFPVTVARRLQESAQAGEILLGPSTFRLVREAATCVSGPRVPLGSERTPTWRLRNLIEGAPAIPRRFGAPLVGRDEELAALRGAFDAAVRERGCELVVVVGEPGIGKSRLAVELAARLTEDATVLVGHCVAYGEGATWLPLVEALRDALRDEPKRRLESLLAAEPGGERTANAIARLLADTSPPGSTIDAFWSVRRLLDALAMERPLVLVLEDVHAAEPTLLDFVDYLEGFEATAPILVVAVGRPELLDRRGMWGDRAISLHRLEQADVLALLDNLESAELEPAVLDRVAEAAEGNPLLAEQLLAWATEGGSLDVLPPSVEALLHSRIDLLSEEERAALERAAVIGREFSLLAAQALAPPDSVASVRPSLVTLVRKGHLEPAPSRRLHEDGFRFHHALVREAAYAGVPKAARADLHEQCAEWLGAQEAAQDEVVGYHLEQAYRHRAELGPIDRHARGLAADAGTRLGDAGIRAWKRGDVPATVNLLSRATALLSTSDARRCELLCELGVAHRASGDVERAREVLAEAIEGSTSVRDRRLELRGRIELTDLGLLDDPEADLDEFLTLAASAIQAFEAVDDDRSLGRTWHLVGHVHGGMRCQNAAWADAAERARVHYERSGWPPSMAVSALAVALYHGPTPVPEGIEQCDRLLAGTDERGTQANIRVALAGFEAMRGEFERARRLLDQAGETFGALGLAVHGRHAEGWMRSQIELLAGDADEAARLLRENCDFFESVGHGSLVATGAGELAEALYRSGRAEEAEKWTQVAEAHASPADLSAQFQWRGVRAKVLAHAGQLDSAETLAREGVALVERTDAVNQHACLLLDLAEVLRVGETDDPAEPATEALALFREKGNLVGAERARSFIEGSERYASSAEGP